ALLRARTLVRESARNARADHEQSLASIETLREQLNGLAAQLEEARREAACSSSVPRPGMNMSKRSQALRMQRRGDVPAGIASALGLPLQEVDLLLKVHRIVMSSVGSA